MARHKYEESPDEIAAKLFVISFIIVGIGWYLSQWYLIGFGGLLFTFTFCTIAFTAIRNKHKLIARNEVITRHREIFVNFLNRSVNPKGNIIIGGKKYTEVGIEFLAEEISKKENRHWTDEDIKTILEEITSQQEREWVSENVFKVSDQKNLNALTGTGFEQLLRDLFSRMGYHVSHNGGAGDQGADLILAKNGVRTVVQAKRYTDLVNNTAVQQAVAAKGVHNCTGATVVTTSDFTPGAIENARANNVVLIAGTELRDLLKQHLQQTWI